MIDTNIVIDLLRGHLLPPTQVQIYTCAIVLGELYFGARKSSDPTGQLRSVNEFLENVPIIDCDKDTATEYSLLRHALEAAGGRIPENDMWIAALAIQHQLTLVSRDAHFARISGLTIETW
ncbi:MAG: type II toxin-antitoxin system VapC family toxin [Anaerolineae bacterium]|nr:type II toxin-antitoxin system VapC family toxin [Anaerolineae bacterium]